MLRQCLEWIDSPEAQANATIFVAKFFGRADLMAFISTVPERQRPCVYSSNDISFMYGRVVCVMLIRFDVFRLVSVSVV